MRRGSPRIVVDTNVLISSTINQQGASARILDAVRSGKLILIASPLLLDEFDKVIHRARISKKYPRTTAGAKEFLEYLSAKASIVRGIPASNFVREDPKDDIVVASALEGNADCIVSGDRHLLALKEISDIPILTPAEFARRFKL